MTPASSVSAVLGHLETGIGAHGVVDDFDALGHLPRSIDFACLSQTFLALGLQILKQFAGIELDRSALAVFEDVQKRGDGAGELAILHHLPGQVVIAQASIPARSRCPVQLQLAIKSRGPFASRSGTVA